MVLYENIHAVSLGLVEQRKEHNNLVKYKISYKDSEGKLHSTWTNWMRDDGYKVGDSIPVKSIAPFGRVNIPVAIDCQPQRHIAPYIAALAIVNTCSWVIGYKKGKRKWEN